MLGLNISAELFALLKQRADEQGISVRTYIIRLLRSHVNAA